MRLTHRVPTETETGTRNEIGARLRSRSVRVGVRGSRGRCAGSETASGPDEGN